MEKELYLVLSQTGSVLSKTIKVYTRTDFSHASIALSRDLEPMYSFGRKNPYNPLIAGFVKEHVHSGTFRRFPNTYAAVLAVPVSEEIHSQISAVLSEMYQTKEDFGYDFIGLCLAAIKIEKPRKNRYYCSEFVKTILQKYQVPGAETLGRFVAPSDFLDFPNAKLIYQGLLKDYTPCKEEVLAVCNN